MPKKIGILIIHGMGSQKRDFADRTILKIDERLQQEHHKNPKHVAWETVYWADVLEKRQNAFLQRAGYKNDLDWDRLRKFAVKALGDAVAYQQVQGQKNVTYKKVHSRVEAQMMKLYSKLSSPAKPLIIIAHSLGTVIMSNYIWDIQKRNQTKGGHKKSGSSAVGKDDFKKMHSLVGIITFGCNLPLFSFAYHPIDAIQFPPKALDGLYATKAKWLNFYDRDDVLAYPLKPVSASYNKSVTEDIEIKVSGVLKGWNPAAHSKYWTAESFINGVAGFIAEFL
jgi:hypothetical protein